MIVAQRLRHEEAKRAAAERERMSYVLAGVGVGG